MKIDNLGIYFENCDYLTFGSEYICDFCVEEIESSFNRVAVNAIKKTDSAGFVFFGIHPDANVEYSEFGVFNSSETKFNRVVKYNDITSIEFDYIEINKDGSEKSTHYEYTVNWCKDGQEDFENKNQKSYISEVGSLYVVISKDKNISDCIDMRRVNNNEYMDALWKVCRLGNKNDEHADTNDDENFDGGEL